MSVNAACGMRHAEWKATIPHSALRTPHGVTGARLLLAVLFLLWASAAVMACPACKESLFDPSQLHQKLSAAKGYALSIGLLLSVPAALVGGIARLVVRASRRRARSTEAGSPD